MFTQSLTESQWPAAYGHGNVYCMSVAPFDENEYVIVGLRRSSPMITFATVVMT